MPAGPPRARRIPAAYLVTAALLAGVPLLLVAAFDFRQYDRLRVEADGTIASQRMLVITFAPLEWWHRWRQGRIDGSERRLWYLGSWRPHALPAPIPEQVRSYVLRNRHQPLALSSGLDEGDGTQRVVHLSLFNGVHANRFNAFWTLEDGVFVGCTLDGEPIDPLTHTLPAAEGMGPDADRSAGAMPGP